MSKTIIELVDNGEGVIIGEVKGKVQRESLMDYIVTGLRLTIPITIEGASKAYKIDQSKTKKPTTH